MIDRAEFQTKTFCFLFLSLSFHFLSAQFDSLAQECVIKNMDQMFWLKDNFAVRDSCDKYLQREPLTPSFRSKLIGYKALAISFWTEEKERVLKRENSAPLFMKEYRQIDSLFLLAAETYPRNKTEYYCLGYEFFKERDPDEFTNYRDSIIRYGFKPPLRGLALNIDFLSGQNAWLGVEAGGFFYDRYSRVGQKINGKKVNPDVYFPYSCDVLTFGFRKILNNKNMWGINFSPVSGSWMWLNIRPFNVVYYSTPKGNSIAYNPEIGIRFWYFFLNLSHHFFVNESAPDISKNMFNFKMQIPLKQRNN